MSFDVPGRTNELEHLRHGLIEHAHTLRMMADGHLSHLNDLAEAEMVTDPFGDRPAVDQVKDTYLKIVTAFATVVQALQSAEAV